MRRNSRTLSLLERQRRMAIAARRQAMVGLADLIDLEWKSSDLARRSEGMARDYGQRTGAQAGAELSAQGAYAGAMAQAAKDAARSSADAAQRRDEMSFELASVEQRIDRLDEKLRSEERDAARSAEARIAADGSALARKLPNHTQMQSRNQSRPAPTPRSKGT